MAYIKRRETKCCPLQVACDGTDIAMNRNSCPRCAETLRRRAQMRADAEKIQAEIYELSRHPNRRGL